MKTLGMISLAFFSLYLVACSNSVKKETVEAAKFEYVEPKLETVVYEYEQGVNGVMQKIQEMLTYTGEEFQTLELQLQQPLSQEIQDMVATQGFETIKTNLIKIIEEESFVKDLRTISGVQLSIDIPSQSEMQVKIILDMKSVDLKKLSQIEGIGFDFEGLSQMTPKEYRNHLLSLGAKQVSTSEE